MGFETVNSLDADVTIAIGKVDKTTGKPYPKQAEGYYLGNRSVESKRGDSKLHFLQTAKGNVGVWGTTDLNRKLSVVTPGTMVRITSTGKKPTPNGDMYMYKVEVDKENTIEVSLSEASPAANNEAADSDSDYSGGTDDGGYNDTGDTSDADEEVAQAAALAAAERKAKVDALLKRNNKTK